jgi:RNA polymerase sigma factor (sigma-70 family)
MPRRPPSGFETFYRSAKDPCFRALLATVGSAGEADDLLSEAFTRALARWAEVQQHPRPEAWVVRTALNLHRDRWRRSQRQRRLQARREPVGYIDAVDPALLAAVRSLPTRQREVIALRVLLELSADETAEVLSIEPGTVGTHLRRGLAALRAALSDPPDPNPSDPTIQEVLR